MRDPVYVWQNLDKYQVQRVGEKKFYDQDTFDLLLSGPVILPLSRRQKSLQIVGCQYQGMTQSGPAAMEDSLCGFPRRGRHFLRFQVCKQGRRRSCLGNERQGNQSERCGR